MRKMIDDIIKDWRERAKKLEGQSTSVSKTLDGDIVAAVYRKCAAELERARLYIKEKSK